MPSREICRRGVLGLGRCFVVTNPRRQTFLRSLLPQGKMGDMPTVIANRYLTVTQAAAELHLTSQRVRQLIKSGQLKGEPAHPRLTLIDRKALDAFKKLDRPTGLNVDKRENPRKRRAS